MRYQEAIDKSNAYASKYVSKIVYIAYMREQLSEEDVTILLRMAHLDREAQEAYLAVAKLTATRARLLAWQLVFLAGAALSLLGVVLLQNK